jgi:hypothetical protein
MKKQETKKRGKEEKKEQKFKNNKEKGRGRNKMTVEMEMKCKRKGKKTYIRNEGQVRCPGPGGKNIRHVVLP